MRRGQQSRRSVRQARKAAEAELGSQVGRYTLPDRSQCREKQWHTAYDEGNTVRLQFNTWRTGNQIADFVILVQRLSASGWEDVERFDCHHGHCHLHAEQKDGTLHIYRLDVIGDVVDAFAAASREADERVRIIRDKGVSGE